MVTPALQVVKNYFPHVNRVVDASKPLTIEVTAIDNLLATTKDHNACAMVQACKRALNADGAIVSRSKAYVIVGNQATRYALGQAVAREIVSFDRGSGFAPGLYQLKAITASNRLGIPHKRSGPKTSKKKLFRHVTTNVRTILGQ